MQWTSTSGLVVGNFSESISNTARAAISISVSSSAHDFALVLTFFFFLPLVDDVTLGLVVVDVTLAAVVELTVILAEVDSESTVLFNDPMVVDVVAVVDSWVLAVCDKKNI